MVKYLQQPVRLLFVTHALSIFTFCYLHWNSNSIHFSETADFTTTATPFLSTLGKSIEDWLQYISSLAVLYFAFLAGLKMVSSISFKELLIFVLVTIPCFGFTTLLLGRFSSPLAHAYLVSSALLLFSYGLLKISGHWSGIDESWSKS
jgi:hypothetical protein